MSVTKGLCLSFNGQPLNAVGVLVGGGQCTDLKIDGIVLNRLS